MLDRLAVVAVNFHSMQQGALWISLIALAVSLLAAVFCGFSAYFQRRPADYSALESRISALNLDLTDLSDRTQQWIRRAAVRATREKEPTDPGIIQGAVSMADRKAQLRARLRQKEGTS